MTFDGSQVNFLIAFLGGVITFFASCFLPLVPSYLAYLTGVSRAGPRKRDVLVNSIIFSLGFITIFVLLGASASYFGVLVAQNRRLIQIVGGSFLVVMGLTMLGFAKTTILGREFKFYTKLTRWKKLNSYIIGSTFGFAWTPCIGPVLAVILYWASQAETIVSGTMLLLVYGLGLGFPFVLFGLFFDYLSHRISVLTKFGHNLQIAAGLLIVVTGVLLALGKLQYFSILLLDFFDLRVLAV
jgi:cytochrome c-type biogenesis protein